MYKIFHNSQLIYSPNNPATALTLGRYEAEINKIPYFVFCVPLCHPNYNSFEKMKSIITVKNNESEIFRGRVLNEEIGLWGEKKIVCEGEIAYLLDSLQKPYNFLSEDNKITVSGLFCHFINNHNSSVEQEKRFTVGEISVNGHDRYIARSGYNFDNTYNSIYSKLVDHIGGVLRVRNNSGVRYIDYINEQDIFCNQTLEIGKNIFDITDSIKGQDIFTGIVPLGANGIKDINGRLTIGSVNGGVDYILNSNAVKKYGRIIKPVIFEGITDVNRLKSIGVDYVNSLNIPSHSITVNAFDLSQADSCFDSFKVGDKVRIISKIQGLDGFFTAKKVCFDLLKPENNKLYLGSALKTLTSQMVKKAEALNKETKSISEITDNRLGEIFNRFTIEDNSILLNGTIKQETAILPLFNLGWSNRQGSAVSFYKDSLNCVHISGNASKTNSAENTIFTLPEFYRPIQNEIFICASNQGLCYVTVNTDGNILCDESFGGQWISLSGINFRLGG